MQKSCYLNTAYITLYTSNKWHKNVTFNEVLQMLLSHESAESHIRIINTLMPTNYGSELWSDNNCSQV